MSDDREIPKKNSIYSRAGRFLGLNKSPLNDVFSSVHFEMNSNREVIVEGCKSILEYDQNIIKIRVKKMVVCFNGRGLNIECLTSDSLIIKGFIINITFLT